MIISMIAAASENNVIGKDNKMAWHMPSDLKYFMDTTTGHHIIMGRKNFESLDKRPLKNRTNVVITRTPDYTAEGCELVTSLEEALVLARNNGEQEAMIIGGGEIYRLGMEMADRIYLTRIHTNVEGDVTFPELDPDIWKEVSRDARQADERNPFDYTFLVFERS
jgi:dihydrofolate reductase